MAVTVMTPTKEAVTELNVMKLTQAQKVAVVCIAIILTPHHSAHPHKCMHTLINHCTYLTSAYLLNFLNISFAGP